MWNFDTFVIYILTLNLDFNNMNKMNQLLYWSLSIFFDIADYGSFNLWKNIPYHNTFSSRIKQQLTAPVFPYLTGDFKMGYPV